MFELKTEARDIKVSPKIIRGKGKLPAVFYGNKEKSTSITVDPIQFKKVWKKAGESSIVTLKTGKGELSAVINEVQLDPVKDEPTHVDFYIIDKNKILEVAVPLEFTGVSPAVKDLGGVLVKVLHELEIEALPKDLPHSLTVDISTLDQIDSQVAAKDIVLPSGVKLNTKETDIVALIAAPREEKEEEEVPTAIDMSAIEVEKRGKKEEEGEGGEAVSPEAETAK